MLEKGGRSVMREAFISTEEAGYHENPEGVQ